MAKFIVLCLDGTWNAPDVYDAKAKCYTPTNVQTLFECLQGSAPLAPTDQEKEITGSPTLVGKYIYGVGASTNELAAKFDGALGNGLVARIVRGYTYLSREYQAGDRIVIVGFSRGAYTARAIAGLVTSQGLLDWQRMGLNVGSPESYSAGLAAWEKYKSSIHGHDAGFVQQVRDVALSFREKLDLLRHPSPPLQFVEGVEIEAVAVWDTVGALGIPELHDYNGSVVRKDVYEFADFKLNDKVKNGFHAIAIDEARVDFTPSLWDDDPRIVQVLFPGAHSDVGGGYIPAESGLANCALHWMVKKLQSLGVPFRAAPTGMPDPKAIQHAPWAGTAYLTAPRVIRPGLRVSTHVLQRATAPAVPVQGGASAPYQARNLLGSYLMPPGTVQAAKVVIEP